MKVPETFTGQRDDVTRFVRQCRVYLAAKPREFQTEMEKQLWITSLCHGKVVEGWVDWVTSMLVDRNVEAPQSATEMLAYLKIYFGDPDEKSTARHDLDHLVQVRRVEEYVTAFQSIAYKTEYSEAELEHRFIVGLKQEIRDKCLAAYPRPEGLGEWISRAYALQHAFDLNVNYSRAAQPSNTYRGRMPGRLAPQAQARYPYRKPYNPPDYRQTFNRPQAAPQSQPQTNAQPAQKADRSRVTCHHCGRFGHMEKDCRRKLGLCLRCGKGGHVARDCNMTERVRRVEGEEEEEKQEQGFVEDL